MPPPASLLSLLLVVAVGVSSPSRPAESCRAAERWPSFCSALLGSSLLNATGKEALLRDTPTAQAFFCDMLRVLDKIDCAQPFTVSPTWRTGCQEAYRDWSCSLIGDTLLSPHLSSCDSTCHQVVRVCPYLSPDRVQVDSQGKAALHPSQYGGHPAFHCPSTATEDPFFIPSPPPYVCLLFDPNEAGLGPTNFPLRILDLRNVNFTYCQDQNNIPNVGPPIDKDRPLNVSHCCWTYDTALPRTYTSLASTILRRGLLEDENCQAENQRKPEEKEIILQCFVSQETQTSTDPPPDDFGYLDDERPKEAPDEDPSIDGYNSAEGEAYEEDEDYENPQTTTEAFLALIRRLETQTPVSLESKIQKIPEESKSLRLLRERRSVSGSCAEGSGPVSFLLLLPILLLFYGEWNYSISIMLSSERNSVSPLLGQRKCSSTSDRNSYRKLLRNFFEKSSALLETSYRVYTYRIYTSVLWMSTKDTSLVVLRKFKTLESSRQCSLIARKSSYSNYYYSTKNPPRGKSSVILWKSYRKTYLIQSYVNLKLTARCLIDKLCSVESYRQNYLLLLLLLLLLTNLPPTTPISLLEFYRHLYSTQKHPRTYTSTSPIVKSLTSYRQFHLLNFSTQSYVLLLVGSGCSRVSWSYRQNWSYRQRLAPYRTSLSQSSSVEESLVGEGWGRVVEGT